MFKKEPIMNEAPCAGGTDPCFVIPQEPECPWEAKSQRFGTWREHGYYASTIWGGISGFPYSNGEMATSFIKDNPEWELEGIKSVYDAAGQVDYTEVWLKRRVCE